jgi:hypothetical protein
VLFQATLGRTDVCARLGANVDRYSLTATDLHRLLLAGLPAHNLLNLLVGRPGLEPGTKALKGSIGQAAPPAHRSGSVLTNRRLGRTRREIDASFNFSDAGRRVIDDRRGPSLKLALALRIGFLRMTARLLDRPPSIPRKSHERRDLSSGDGKIFLSVFQIDGLTMPQIALSANRLRRVTG